ncbi:dirigent protein 23-like [Pistacia vera]|uniref:dirigent protein 23-like n=1 Tax=Pistacia vera TaxID=55513 RepID=UPI001262CE90|nr:dirigent protein 23-like [Pistacia vera]
MASATKFLLLVLLLMPFYFYTTEAHKSNVTHIEFYMHDMVGGPNPTTVQVVARSNFTGPDPVTATYGSIFVIDNPLTVSSNPNSTVLEHAQGIYTMSSQHKEISLLMSLTYVFTSGTYNGSSFSVLGRNPVMREEREMPIVGGTGIFLLTRGYSLVRTFFHK